MAIFYFSIKFIIENTHVRPVASYQSQVSKEQDKLKEQDQEVNKALALKEHYFGQKNIVINFFHLILCLNKFKNELYAKENI